MKKIYVHLSIFLSLSITACNETTKDQEKSSTSSTKASDEKPLLWIQKHTATKIKGVENDKKETSKVDTDYFEIALGLVNQDKGYIATKDIEKPTSVENFKMVNIAIVDTTGEIVHFRSSVDFLNYMSEREYEMIDQTKSKYNTDYTFKRKNN